MPKPTAALITGFCAAWLVAHQATRAEAQEASADAPAAEAPAPAETPVVSNTAPPATQAADPRPVVQAPASPVETAPAVEPTVAPAAKELAPLKIATWMHLSNRFQNFGDPQKLDRFSQENILYLIATGDVVEKIGYQLALVAQYGPTSPTSGSINGSVTILDAIAKLDLSEPFNVWAGRMLVPSDRSNFSGFWFQAPWYYPGGYYNAISGDNSFFGAPVGPRQGPAGRNDGVTVWGQFGGGLFKYYAGAYDAFSADNNPLISSRINLALINPEPGYFHSSVYYGTKDILAIGASAQYQKSKGGAKDYSEISADILFEKNFHGAGTLDLESTVYKYFASAMDLSYYVTASYLTPEKIGPGFIQPLVRLQQAKPVGQDIWTIVEAQLGYIISQDAARIALGYQWQKAGGIKSNALYVGLQLMK
ncbi:MAG: hypothetical protein ABW321_07720 [Polyangiales bacterium]